MPNNRTKILGIDPGYDRIGIAIIEKAPKTKELVLYSDCLQTSAKDHIYKRFLEIGAEIDRVLDRFEPDAVAIETLFITRNQKTAMRVSEVRGIIIYQSIKRNIPVFEYSPMQIKTAITGDGTSDKTRMVKMVELLVKLPKGATKKTSNKKDDEYDAIAVALAHSAYQKQI
jgi:crossover junction endodeoxyribonuclease RuvC